MSALAIVLIAVGGLVAVLLVGGLIVATVRRRSGAAQLHRQLEEANRALALAHAQDKGWERSGLEAAAREAFAARSGQAVRELQLVHVIDRPGTEQDLAVFRVVTDDDNHEVRLARHGDHWHPEGPGAGP